MARPRTQNLASLIFDFPLNADDNTSQWSQIWQYHVVGCLYSIQYKSIFGAPDKVRRDTSDKARPLSQV